MIDKTLVQQIKIISYYSDNMANVIKRMRLIGKWLETIGNDNNIKIALVNHCNALVEDW